MSLDHPGGTPSTLPTPFQLPACSGPQHTVYSHTTHPLQRHTPCPYIKVHTPATYTPPSTAHTPAPTPTQVHRGQVAEAEECLTRLRQVSGASSTPASQLQARITLAKWPSAPDACCAQLAAQLGLDFDDTPPAALQQEQLSGSSTGDAPASTASAPLTSLTDADYSFERVIQQAGLFLFFLNTVYHPEITSFTPYVL